MVGVAFSNPASSVTSTVLDPAGVNLTLADIGSRDNNDGSGATCEVTFKGEAHSITSGTKTIRVTTAAAMRVDISFMSFSNVLDQTYNTAAGNYDVNKGVFTTTTTMTVTGATGLGGWYMYGGGCATQPPPPIRRR